MSTTSSYGTLGGGQKTVIAEDVLKDKGGVFSQRGPIGVVQNVENGFALFRQHVTSTGGNRPAPSVGAYPNGLWLQGIGKEADGYGSADDGNGTFINLERGREGVYVTMSWWWGIKSPAPDAVGTVSFYCDTEAFGSARRSFFGAHLNLATGNLGVRGDGAYPTEPSTISVQTVPVPGWNDNKYDRHYTSLTVWVGPSSATGVDFGRYVAFQMGSTVVDLRPLNLAAAWTPQTEITGMSFSGGFNPGIGFTTPVAGKAGGIVLYDFLTTIGDTIV